MKRLGAAGASHTYSMRPEPILLPFTASFSFSHPPTLYLEIELQTLSLQMEGQIGTFSSLDGPNLAGAATRSGCTAAAGGRWPGPSNKQCFSILRDYGLNGNSRWSCDEQALNSAFDR